LKSLSANIKIDFLTPSIFIEGQKEC